MKRTKKVRGRANGIDAYVGSRLRTQRTLMGLSQSALGKAMDLTFQQVQKYESGANRMGASRLYQVSQVLGVGVAFFFSDMPKEAIPKNWGSFQGVKAATMEKSNDPMHKRETLELVRNYFEINDPDIRRQIRDMIKTFGSLSVLNKAIKKAA